MANETLVRFVHLPLFGFLFIVTLIEMAIAASLVDFWNNNGYPDTSLRDRSRILLVAGIWSVLFALYFCIGVFLSAASVAFGILVHLIGLGVGFILMLIGTASLTAHIIHRDCGNVKETFSRCNVTKGLEVMSWICTIWLFVCLLFVLFLGVKARSSTGIRRGTLADA